MKILLPTDFSDNSYNAISYAMELMGAGHEWTLLHCYHTPHAGARISMKINDILAEQSKSELAQFEQRVKAGSDPIKYPIKTMSEHGEVIQVVDMLAKREGYEFIAMGTTGASGLKEVLFGSIASKVIEHSRLPVLAVPASAEFHGLGKLAVADDLESVSNKDAAWIALQLIDAYDPKVILVTVSSKGGENEFKKGGSDIDDLFSSAAKRSHHVVEHRDISKGLRMFNKEQEIDMIVMLHRKESGFVEWLTVSTAEEMAMRVRIPLLVIKG